MNEPLIQNFATTEPKTLEDLLMCLAKNIEDSMRQCGAEAGKDYTLLDLYKLAQPFALAMFNQKSNGITFAVSWPY